MDVIADLRRRAEEAERIGATAPVASILKDVIATLEAGPVRMLTVKEAAAVLGVTPDWVYRHQHTIPGRRKLHGLLRFDERRLREYRAK